MSDKVLRDGRETALLQWYTLHGRLLPWRETKNPYLIWISEVILQQTRVEQGLPYYLRLTERYPTVESLAAADEQEVLKLWQGLGYYSRARNMLATAREVQRAHGGSFPKNYDQLLALKGIGPYTAAAIASFAFDLPYAVADGNVARVLSRWHDLEQAVNDHAGKKLIQALADAQLPTSEPARHNQAMMELGALCCKPAQPECTSCPVAAYCQAWRKGTVAQRPVKVKKAASRPRHMDYAVIELDDALVFRRRQGKDIWQGLHDFAALEGIAQAEPEQVALMVTHNLPELTVSEAPRTYHRTMRHLLSHQRIEARFWYFKASGEVSADSVYLTIPKSRLEELPVPRLIHRYLEECEWL